MDPINLKVQSEFKYSNKLIEAKYRLSLTQQRIILTLASQVKADDEKNKQYKINIREFAASFGINGEGILALFKNATKDLLSKPVILEDENGTIQFNWISSAVYHDQESFVILKFDSILRPYLLEIKDKFTLFLLNCFSGLKSYYSIRIYMLLKQYTKIGYRKFKLKELREILGVGEDEYKLYSDFRARALQKAKDEINAHTDIKISFEEEKIARKVDEIVFSIEEKDLSEKRNAKKNSSKPKSDNENNQLEENFKKAYLLYNEGKTITVFPFERNKLKFKKCLKNLGTTEKLLEQIKNYKEYLKIADWRDPKGFSAWINDPELFADDWLAAKVREDKKNGNYIPSVSEKSDILPTKIDEDSEEIKTIRSNILSNLNLYDQRNHMAIYRKFFAKAEIKISGESRRIIVESSEALIYQTALDRINIKIDVK